MRVAGDRISFRLHDATGDLSARLATGCASAVPSGAPHEEGGVFAPLSSAGPYYPDTHIEGQQIVLLRNPNYGGTRPQNLDAVILTLGSSSDEAARAVERGEADWVAAQEVPTGALRYGGELARKYGPAAGKGQRWFSEPVAAVRFLVPNWRAGPLRDARLRRGVSLALDRPALADVWHGTSQATIVPPGVPGYVPPPSTVDRPHIAQARKLVAGKHVTLDLMINDNPEEQRIADLVRGDLARVGIGLRVRSTSAGDNVVIANDPKAGIDLLALAWYMDFPDPGNAVADLVAPTTGQRVFPELPAGAEPPPWERTVTEARRVVGPSRVKAFERVDQHLATVDVPLIVYAAEGGRPVFFSDRVGCHTLLPMFGGMPDLTSLCLK
jgi:ABC-type transport system substrate-binding protein